MAGEVTDPRVKALLLGGGAVAAGLPFGIGALMDKANKPAYQGRIDRAKQRRADKFAARAAAQAPKTGIMSTLGRFAGPAGAVAGALMPTQMGDGTLQGNEVMLQGNAEDVLSRKMFADEAVATEGLAQAAGALDQLDDDIESAEDFTGIMNAIRGDDASIEDRRTELGKLVGGKDAKQTPDSVLTLIQPTMSILEASEEGEGSEPISAEGTGITSGLVDQAPGQAEAVARMAMGEQPVMRAEGTGEGGEKIAGKTVPLNLSNLSLIEGLVDQPTSYDTYLQQYQSVLGDGKTGYELNPYIAGLNLAAAVANAPKGELISSILAPETIKSVSDPIMQMAQARGKQDQALKLKALEAATASKSAAASAKSDLLKTALPKLLESPDLKQFGDAESGFYAFDPANPTNVFTLKEGTGVKPTVFGNKTSGYGYLDKDNNYVSVVAGQGEPPKVFGSDTFGYFYLDENDAVQTAKEGFGKDAQIFGNATIGYFSFDGKEATPIEGAEGTGVQAPEFIQLMDRYSSAQSTLNNAQSTPEDIAKASQEMMFLSDKLTTKDPEFTSLMNQKADLIYQQTQGTEQQKQAAKDEFIGRTIDQFIAGKTTVAQNYNPNEALDKEFAGIFGKQVESINKGAEQASKLQSMSDMAVLASNSFETGAFAETRLNVIKMIDAVGGRDKLRGLIGDDRFNELFSADTNDVKSGELLKSIGAQFAVMMAESFPGNLNQSEVDLIKAAGPNLAVSPDGLKTLQKVFTAAGTRAQAESQYASDFLQDAENQGLGAEAKYAKFNQGLAEVRAANPVITEEMVSAIDPAIEPVPDGGARMTLPGGGSDVLSANQLKVWDKAQSAQSLNDFVADWPNIIATYPEFANADPQGTYNLLKPMRRSN